MKPKREVFATERLTLYPFAECDEQRMLEIFSNEQIKQTYMIPDFQDMEQAKALFRRIMELSKSDGHFTYGIYLGGELIGFINDCEMSDAGIELDDVILPEHQGKGYATEALRDAIHELFQKGIQKVTAGFFEENHASQRVMEKCGMHRIEQEEDIEYRGSVHHCLYYKIDRSHNQIHLEDIDPGNWRLGLKVAESQRDFVADSRTMLARAYAYRNQNSRAFVVYDDETPVGMGLYHDCPEMSAYDFSQLFIDERYQGRGYGKAATKLVLDTMKQDGRFNKVVLCYIEGNGAAKNLYEQFGFAEIDRDEDEIIMELSL